MKKLIFMGTPSFASIILNYLAEKAFEIGVEIVAVYTQPDKPAGRGQHFKESIVKQVAKELGIPVYQPHNFKDDVSKQMLASLNPDILWVAAYGLILPQAVLDIPKLGAYNVHASLLPQWRGAAPVQRAIMAGDTATGITIMRMEKGLDTGDMLLQKAIPIASNDTSSTLLAALAELGGKLSETALKQIFEERAAFISQNNEIATYAPKIEKSEYFIDWSCTSEEIDRKVRALESTKAKIIISNTKEMAVHILKGKVVSNIVPFPQLTEGAILSKNNLLLISTQDIDKAYSIEILKPEGKKAMLAKEFINGYLK